MQAIEEAEYKAYDVERAKAADELMWLDFETRMRHLMKNIVTPALQLSVEDRESNIELEIQMTKATKRLELLEQAVYQKKTCVGRTIFDVYNEKIANMQQFVRDETQKLHDTQSSHKEQIEGCLFK